MRGRRGLPAGTPLAEIRADIGFSGQAWQANRQLPLIAYQGHHGYMVVITGESPDAESDRPLSCPQWLTSDRPWEAS